MKLDHIGIAQPNSQVLSKVFADLGLPPFEEEERLDKQKVVARFSKQAGIKIELVSPSDDESPIAKFLTTKGPGLHHLAFLVDDIQAERKRLEDLGYQALGDAPTIGASGKWVQFFHPRDTGGVLIELCQYAH